MQVKDVMHKKPAYCLPDSTLQEAAQQMVNNDCGAIPVVEDRSLKLAGIITDRDIVCRSVAKGQNPTRTRVADCMSHPLITVQEESSLEECLELMKKNQVRRIPVVNEAGACQGIVTQAQISRHVTELESGELVRTVSRKTGKASTVATAAG